MPRPSRIPAGRCAVVAAILAAAVAVAIRDAPPVHAASKCPTPPLEITILPAPVGVTGPAAFEVTDAVTRRVPIVPRPSGARIDAEELDQLREEAAETDLALYTMYLADFDVPRKELKGFGFGDVSAPDGKTVAALTIVPTEKNGFEAGDVAEVAPFEYDATTTFAPLSLVVSSSGEQASYAYSDVEGKVKIRKLSERSICLDFDVTFTLNDRAVASVEGAAKSPVVRSAPTFFFT